MLPSAADGAESPNHTLTSKIINFWRVLPLFYRDWKSDMIKLSFHESFAYIGVEEET